jgi:two-component system sensor histidine kinase BaeS
MVWATASLRGKAMRSLTVKLVLAFTIVSLIGIALVAIMTAQFTGKQLRNLLATRHTEDLLAELEDYYLLENSWQGIEHVINNPDFVQQYGRSYVVLDIEGQVIPFGPGFFPKPGAFGAGVRPEDGVPIVVDGRTVGFLITEPPRFDFRPPFTDQITRFYVTLLYASLGAVFVSLLLGVFLARTLTRTVRELTVATRKVAKGDLEQQVPVRSKDELGELAASFNQMSADLTHSRNLRRQMTADIAHELRTPLTVVLGHAEALSEGQLPPDPDTFDIIFDETKRLNRLVEDLRTLSVSDAGELLLNQQKTPPLELLKRGAAARRSKAKVKDLALEVEASPGLPDLIVDPDRMTQVLVNLLDNAIRYTPSGGIISLFAKHTPEGVAIIVKDNGPGISKEDLPYVFERFYRGDKSRQREEGGSGLGLPIAKSLVENQGGDIQVESKVGAGTTFTIYLPVVSEGESQ